MFTFGVINFKVILNYRYGASHSKEVLLLDGILPFVLNFLRSKVCHLLRQDTLNVTLLVVWEGLCWVNLVIC